MKHYLIIIFFAVTSCPVLAQSEEWVRHLSGNDKIQTKSMVSFNDKLFITGLFEQDVCINENANFNCFIEQNFNLNFGTNNKGFLLCIDNEGNYQWSVLMPIITPTVENFFDVDVDTSGAVLVCATFQDTGMVYFPNGDSLILESNSFRNAFVLKLDSSGDLIWSKIIKGKDGGYVNRPKLCVNSVNDIIIAGESSDTIDFGTEQNSIPSSGGNFFIVKYDENFNYIWSYSLTGEINASDLTADIEGNIIITGAFEDTVNFKPYGTPYEISALNEGNEDVYLMKLTNDGLLAWVKKTAMLKNNDLNNPFLPQILPTALSCDEELNIYSLNLLSDTAFIGTDNIYDLRWPLNIESAYITKYNADGKQIWYTPIGHPADTNESFTYPRDLFYENGKLFSTGHYTGSIDFNLNDTIIESNNYSGIYDGYIIKIDSSGTIDWNTTYTGLSDKSYQTTSNSIIKSDSTIYTTGFYYGSVSFPFTNKPNDTLLVSSQNDFSIYNSFIHKFRDPDFEEEVTPEPEFNLNVFPNPTKGIINIELGKTFENISITLYSTSGKKVIQKKYTNTMLITFDTFHLNSGVYILEVNSDSLNPIRIKIIKI